jgi:hypothetical protein
MAKVLVSLNDRLVARLDREAAARGLTGSALLAELVARGLGEPIGPGGRPEEREALEWLQELCREVRVVDSRRIIREMRDERTERDARLG